MKTFTGDRRLSGLFALVLFAVFAVGTLTALTTGADVYRRLTARDDAAYTVRTAQRYLSMKLRQAPGAVDVAAFGDGDALALAEDGYVTMVYCHEGMLHELYCAPDAGLLPEDGEPVVALAAMEARIADGRLTLTLRHADGGADMLYFAMEAAA